MATDTGKKAPPKKDSSSGGHGLTKKVGPLPLWGWLVAGLVAYEVYKGNLLGSLTGSSSTTTPTAVPAGTGGSGGYGGGGSAGSSSAPPPPAPGTTTPPPTTTTPPTPTPTPSPSPTPTPSVPSSSTPGFQTWSGTAPAGQPVPTITYNNSTGVSTVTAAGRTTVESAPGQKTIANYATARRMIAQGQPVYFVNSSGQKQRYIPGKSNLPSGSPLYPG